MVLAGLQGALGCDEKMERRGEEDSLGEERLGEDEPKSGLSGSLVSGLPGSLCIPSISLPGCLRGLSLVMRPAATWHWSAGAGTTDTELLLLVAWDSSQVLLFFIRRPRSASLSPWTLAGID